MGAPHTPVASSPHLIKSMPDIKSPGEEQNRFIFQGTTEKSPRSPAHVAQMALLAAVDDAIYRNKKKAIKKKAKSLPVACKRPVARRKKMYLEKTQLV